MDQKESRPNHPTQEGLQAASTSTSPISESPSTSRGSLGLGIKRKLVVVNRVEESEEVPPVKLQTIDDEHASVIDEDGFFISEPVPDEPMEMDGGEMASMDAQDMSSDVPPRNPPLLARRKSEPRPEAANPAPVPEEDMVGLLNSWRL